MQVDKIHGYTQSAQENTRRVGFSRGRFHCIFPGEGDGTQAAVTMQTIFLISLLVACATGQSLDPLAEQFDITAIEFKRRIDEGFFAAIIDVRTKAEFESGHIENATLIESLASFGTSRQISTPEDLSGCESCDLGIYCQSGNRAGRAIEILTASGFKGRLYNGQGVSQWTREEYPLVTGASTPAMCATTAEGQQACEMSLVARTQSSEGNENVVTTGSTDTDGTQDTGGTPTVENGGETGT